MRAVIRLGVSGDVSAEKAESRQQTYIFHICLIARQTREWQTALLALVGRGQPHVKEAAEAGGAEAGKQADMQEGMEAGKQAG